ncbi:enoyl-CoA hydratase/isomerase family protein [Tahibacter caeni]|uniref:enoyl-CoA hydratase/isomerase family protein n=1 Tax=Tahibacter caeni TaxID=1453545 RepID=UPI0021495A70|nr:enoyl-CoA hydratase/isomerase family protein [Tahibacter caeni]
MLDLIRHDDILELRLARPPVNALDAGLIRALREAIEAAPGDGARGLILSGRSGMFSGGLDVPSLLQLDRDAMTQVWRDLFGACAALARSPIPSVAAITGHSPAGGAVLAIFCDYRVMARGAYRIGLNEVQVGLVVPEPIQRGLRRLVGAYRAERLMVAGTMLDAEQALAAGFVDELVDVDHVVARAQIWLRELLALPPQAMSGTRRIARADLAGSFDEETIFNVEEYVDGWFGDESQHVLQALVAKLKSKG